MKSYSEFIISRIRIYLFLILIPIVFTNCKKSDSPTIQADQEKVFVNNDKTSLNERIIYVQDPVFSTTHSKDNEDYYWYYVAEVPSPVFNGEILSATHVNIIDQKAYVSYNVQGNVYMGGIEVIDLEDPAFPTVITQMLFMGNDANAVSADIAGSNSNRDVYLALSSFKKGAVVRKLQTQNGQFSGAFTDLSLSKYLDSDVISASANGIACTDDYVYVTSGQSEGGVFQISKEDFTLMDVDEFDAAKYVVTNATKQISLSTGDEAKLHVYNIGTGMGKQMFDIGSIYHQHVEEPYYGKSAMHIDQGSDICYVAMGLNGMKAFDITSGAEVYSSPANMLTKGNTNGLTKDDLFVYLANGADGLYIARIPEGSGEIIPVQVWDIDETVASANLVKATEDWLFVAKGGGGLKILRRVSQNDIPPVCEYDELGVPDCLDYYEICDLLQGHMDLTLPEQVNAYENHPEYFLNENYEVELDEAAQLSIVFVSEGAGMKNTFGYYHYPTANPPASVEDIQSSMQIIFPNASELYSGGGLQAGDMLTIPNTFPVGTTVGFFLLTNAWDNGEITEGIYQHYTKREFNIDGIQQHLLMYDSICGCLTLGMEDIISDRGDKDFNDIIVQVHINPETAFNHDEVIQIPPQ